MTGAHPIGPTLARGYIWTPRQPNSATVPKRSTQISFRRSSLGKLCNGVRLRFRHAVASLGMSRHEETAQQVPDDHVGLGDIEAIGNGPEEVALVREGSARLQLLSLFPFLIGVFILALNIFVVARLQGVFVAKNFQGNIAVTLAATSAFIGLFLVVYAIVLRLFERNGTEILPGSTTDDGARQASWYVKWVVVPLLLGLLAVAATISSVEVNRRIYNNKQPCIELYQEATSIYKDNPKFRMPSGDSDEDRCGINKAVLGE
jgi:hypothetical protein